ncbi:phage portal protein [[Clostridium] innocuum]|nr:phage portal protein [[Clostridium] innocuum]
MPVIYMEQEAVRSLTERDIKKLIELSNQSIGRYENLENYYAGKHEILNRHTGDPNIPNNKIVNNMPKYITDTATGYFMGKPVSYSCENEQYMDTLQQIFDYNDEQDENSELEKKCSIDGHCYEMLYVDDQGWIRFSLVTPDSALFIYETGCEHLLAVVRYMKSYNVLTNKTTYYAEFWTDTFCMYFRSVNSCNYELMDIRDHYWSDVPFVEFLNNQERIGDFEGIITLVDAYNLAQSNTANFFQYNDQAILTITNMGDVTTDDVKDMKEKGTVILEDQGSMGWLTKEVNDAALENYKKRLREDMHFWSSVPNMTDESLGSQLSGVAISYKMWNFEQLVVTKERKFKKALQRRIELITNMLNFLGASYDYTTVNMTFRRNMPQNVSEIASMISMLRGFLSDKTLMQLVPNVEDPQEELDRREAEEQATMKKYGAGDYGNLKEDPVLEPDDGS